MLTKQQREYITYRLNGILHESDRAEARAERYELAGDLDKVASAERRIDKCSAQLDIAWDILRCLGHTVRYNLETNDYTILDDK